MANRFCSICRNLYVNDTTDRLVFQCNSCMSKVDANPDDTLRYEEVHGSSIMQYVKQQNNLPRDPTNACMTLTCPSCGYGVASYGFFGVEKRIVYACRQCQHQWW